MAPGVVVLKVLPLTDHGDGRDAVERHPAAEFPLSPQEHLDWLVRRSVVLNGTASSEAGAGPAPHLREQEAPRWGRVSVRRPHLDGGRPGAASRGGRVCPHSGVFLSIPHPPCNTTRRNTFLCWRTPAAQPSPKVRHEKLCQ